MEITAANSWRASTVPEHGQCSITDTLYGGGGGILKKYKVWPLYWLWRITSIQKIYQLSQKRNRRMLSKNFAWLLLLIQLQNEQCLMYSRLLVDIRPSAVHGHVVCGEIGSCLCMFVSRDTDSLIWTIFLRIFIKQIALQDFSPSNWGHVCFLLGIIKIMTAS